MSKFAGARAMQQAVKQQRSQSMFESDSDDEEGDRPSLKKADFTVNNVDQSTPDMVASIMTSIQGSEEIEDPFSNDDPYYNFPTPMRKTNSQQPGLEQKVIDQGSSSFISEGVSLNLPEDNSSSKNTSSSSKLRKQKKKTDLYNVNDSIEGVSSKKSWRAKNMKPGEFLVHNKYKSDSDAPIPIIRAETSLCCKFNNRSKLRRFAISFVYHPRFDQFIVLSIVLNSICMALFDYHEDNKCAYENGSQTCVSQSLYNKTLMHFGEIFGIVFAIEAAIKILAYGAFSGTKTYFKSHWNMLDFVIVIFGLLEMFQLPFLNVRALRTMRILRPIKVLHNMPSLRKQVTALVYSVKGILNVALFLIFIIFLFSVVGLQWFSGAMHYSCRETLTAPLPQNSTWKKLPGFTGTCTPPKNIRAWSRSYVVTCPMNYTCASPYDQNLNISYDGLKKNKHIQFGIGSFDNIGQAMLGIYQIITLDSWSVIYQNLQKWSYNPLVPAIFCFVLVFLGSFFLLNLMLAVVMESYLQSEQNENIRQREQLTKERADLENRMRELSQSTGSSASPNPFAKLKALTQENQEAPLRLEQGKFASKGPVNAVEPLPQKESMLLKMKTGIVKKVRQISLERQSELEQLTGLLGEIKGTSMHDQLQDKILDRVTAAVKSGNLKQMNTVQEQLQNEKNLLIIELELKKLTGVGDRIKNRESKYGLKKEDLLLQKIQGQIRKSIKEKKQLSESDYAAQSQSGSSERFSLELPGVNERRFSHRSLAWGNTQSTLVADTIRQRYNIQDAQSSAVENESVKSTVEGIDNLVMNMSMSLRADDLTQSQILGRQKTQNFSKYQLANIITKGDDIIESEKRQIRSEKNRLFLFCFFIIQHSLFQILVQVSIAANTIVLAMDHAEIEENQEYSLELANRIFYFVFVIEMMLKITGLGFRSYFCDRGNIFDFVIVILSSLDLVATLMRITAEPNSIALVFRIFRLLRIFKLARTWDRFKFFVNTVAETLTKVSSFTILLALFIFMFAILGMELFANDARFDFDNQPVNYFDTNQTNISQKFSVPDSNFDDIYNATLSVFIVLANDGWTKIYFDFYRTSGPIKSSLFFISLLILGQMILFNLLLSILLKEFDESIIIQQEKTADEQKVSNYDRFVKAFRRRFSKQDDPVTDITDAPSKSLNLFADDNATRLWCTRMIEKLDYFIMMTITLTAVTLAFENPLNDPCGPIATTLKYVDYVTTTIFTIECVMKIVSLGLVMNGADSYLRSLENVVDFLVISISIFSYTNIGSNMKGVKVFRIIRLLRPLRLISRNENLKISLKALAVSIPAILSLMFVIMLVFFVFAILGVNLLKEKSYYCDTTGVTGLTSLSEIEQKIDTKQDCLHYHGRWAVKHHNFDNIGSAMHQMVVMSQLVNWPTTMFYCINSRGMNFVPGYKNSPYVTPFFVVFILIGSFFIMGLFTGLVIQAFNKEQKHLGKNFLLTEEQKKMVEGKLLILREKPRIALVRPENKFSLWCYSVAVHRNFEILVLVAILANTVLMAFHQVGEAEEEHSNDQSIHQFVFTGFFLLEAILKLIAFKRLYFRDQWNVFDFVILTFSLVLMGVGQFFKLGVFTTATSQVVRTLRIGRIFKIFRGMTQMQVIITTFFKTIGSLVNVGGLMFLIIYIYSVVAVNLFAEVKHNPPMNELLNFQSPLTSFMSLIQIATGDGWNDLMEALSQENSCHYQCVKHPTYDDLKGGQPVGCGSKLTSALFFYSYLILINLVFLNLFVAQIFDGYFETLNQEAQYFNKDLMGIFKDSWSVFDPDATGQIKEHSFVQLMFDLGHPLGWGPDYEEKPERQDRYLYTASQRLTPHKDNILFFNEVLDVLVTMYVMRREAENEMKVTIELGSLNGSSSQAPSSSSNLDSSNSESLKGEDSEGEGGVPAEFLAVRPGKKLDKRTSAFLQKKVLLKAEKEFNKMQALTDARIVQKYQEEVLKRTQSKTTMSEEEKQSYRSQLSLNFRPNIDVSELSTEIEPELIAKPLIQQRRFTILAAGIPQIDEVSRQNESEDNSAITESNLLSSSSHSRTVTNFGHEQEEVKSFSSMNFSAQYSSPKTTTSNFPKINIITPLE